MFEKKEEKHEEIKITFLNDLISTKEEKPLDIFDFEMTPLEIPFDFRKPILNDLGEMTRKYTFRPIVFQPKIIVKRLTRPVRDLVKVKKSHDVIANYYAPLIDENTINLLSIEDYYAQRGPFPDLIRVPYSPWKKIHRRFKKSLKNSVVSLKHIHLSTLKHEQEGMVEILKTKKNPRKIRLHLSWGYGLLGLLILFGLYVGGVVYLKNTTLEDLKRLNLSISNPELGEDMKHLKKNIALLNLALKVPFAINSIVGNEQMNNFQNVVGGLDNAFQMGIQGLSLYQGVHTLVEQKGVENIMFAQMLKNSPTDELLRDIVVHLQNALSYFSKVKDLGNHDLNQLFFQKREALKRLNDFMQYFYVNKDAFYEILGAEEKRTYLIIFQNSDEIRPTGGFMGSVGIISVFNGRISSFEKKDIYALEWLMKNHKDRGIAFKEPPPVGLKEITESFGLRDANYFYEVSESSQKIQDFLLKIPLKVDGIIYVNQNLVLDLLIQYGGLYSEHAKQEINASNFSMITSTMVEAKISKTDTLSTPKQVMFDFMEAYITKVKSSKNYLPLVQILHDSLKKRDLIVSLTRPKDQELLKPFLAPFQPNRTSSLDFTYPVFTSLSGNKSDRFLTRTFRQSINAGSGCDFQVTHSMDLTHHFSEDDAVKVRKILYDIGVTDPDEVENQLRIQGKGLNKSFVRVLIPPFSQVQSSSLLTVTTYPSYQEVAYYAETKPLETQTFSFQYTLPNPTCQPYTYHFFKQPGIKSYRLEIQKDQKLLEYDQAEYDTFFQ